MNRIGKSDTRPKNQVVVTTVMPEDLITRLNEASGREKMSRSLLIRQACESFLRNQNGALNEAAREAA